MTTDSVITIFNRKKLGGREALIPTVIKGVTWYDHKASDGGKYGDNTDSYAVRIPYDAECDKAYIDRLEYSEEDEDSFWTIQKNDIVVRAELYDVIYNQSDLTKTQADIFKVTDYADNTIRGSIAVKHWLIGGK